MTANQDFQSGSWNSDGSQNPTVSENVQSKLSELTEPMKEKAAQLATEKKDAGADQMRTIAHAVHGAARELEAEMPGIATYIHGTGERIEQAATEIRERNLDELLDKFSGFARQQPAIVFGGAVLTGFILSHFLKSSTVRQTGTSPRTGMTPAGETRQ